MITENHSPLVSIIVPALNEERHIDACFSAISRLKASGIGIEVLLIDNGSTDRTVALASAYAPAFTLAIHEKPGVRISAMRNYGAQQSHGELLAFLDADCIVSEDWLARACETFQEALRKAPPGLPPAIVGCAYQIPEDSTWVARAWNLNPSTRPVAGLVEWIPSGNMFVKRDAFFSVGGFNEAIQTNEDYDLCQRLRDRGYAIVSDPGIAVVHRGTPQTIAAFFRKERWHGRDVFRVFLESGRALKNLKAVAFAGVYVLLMAGCAASVVAVVLGGSFLPLSLFLLAALCIPSMLAVAMARRTQQYRYIPGLSLLYAVYGVARAVCLLDVSTWVSRNTSR